MAERESSYPVFCLLAFRIGGKHLRCMHAEKRMRMMCVRCSLCPNAPPFEDTLMNGHSSGKACWCYNSIVNLRDPSLDIVLRVLVLFARSFSRPGRRCVILDSLHLLYVSSARHPSTGGSPYRPHDRPQGPGVTATPRYTALGSGSSC